MNINAKVSIIGIIILVLFVTIVIKQGQINELKYKSEELQNESVELQKEATKLKKELDIAEGSTELLSCPICNGNPELLPVLQSFYIKCEDCKLQTDYFDSKSELVDYWNTRAY